MTTSFPETKEDFTAENGVTYHWDVNRWRTKTYKITEGDSAPDPRLPYTLETDKTLKESRQVKSEGGEIQLVDAEGNFSNVTFTGRGGTLTGSTAAGITIDTTTLSTLIAGNQQEIQELNNKYDNINIPEYNEPDLDGYLPLTGGTVDGLMTVTFTDAPADNSYVFNVSSPRLPEGQSSAFRVTAAGSVKAGHAAASPFMASANNDVVTKAFADNSYLSLGGGAMTGSMRSKLITCTRSGSGYAFEVKPEDQDETKAAIRIDGSAFLRRTKFLSWDGTPYLAQSQDDVCTKQYTDQAIGEIKMKCATGTASDPSLESGEMYWNTSLKVLYIGN